MVKCKGNMDKIKVEMILNTYSISNCLHVNVVEKRNLISVECKARVVLNLNRRCCNSVVCTVYVHTVVVNVYEFFITPSHLKVTINQIRNIINKKCLFCLLYYCNFRVLNKEN